MTKIDMIQKVCEGIRKRHAASINRDSLYGRGLSSEGYDGGYMQGLQDVILFLNGNIPNSRYRDIWVDVVLENKK